MKKRRSVGENIRSIRLQQAITQEELALRSGLSQGYINHLEMGKRKYTQKSLELIADALSVDIVEFFAAEEAAGTPLASAPEKPVVKSNQQVIRRELLKVVKRLPISIAEHYLTLMKLESDLFHQQRRTQ